MSKRLVLNRRRTAYIVHPDRRLYTQNAVEPGSKDDFRCCVKRCQRRVAHNGSGWLYPVCVAHGAMLGPKLFDAVDALAGASAFNPRAVLAAALLVKKIQTRCAQVARRGKAKRKP